MPKAGMLPAAGTAASLAAAPASQLVSATVSGLARGNAGSVTREKQLPSRRLVSLDGRYVVFPNDATNPTTTPDGNSSSGVFRRDLTTGSTELISLNAAGSATAIGRQSGKIR